MGEIPRSNAWHCTSTTLRTDSLGLDTGMVVDTDSLGLLSSDGVEFQLSFGAAKYSQTLMALASYPEDAEDQEDYQVPDALIPTPTVESAVLEKVIEYLSQTHAGELSVKERFYTYLDTGCDEDMLYNITLAANYLDCKQLLDVCCQVYADYVKQFDTPDKIAAQFELLPGCKDYTPDEEAALIKEHSWINET